MYGDTWDGIKALLVIGGVLALIGLWQLGTWLFT